MASRVARAQPAPPAIAPDALPITYCTALPRADVAYWDANYARYKRFLTPEIRRTQLGLASEQKDVHYWLCRPTTTAHVQLDTLTRIIDPQRLLGHWRSVLMRTVAYTDSATPAQKQLYRSVQLRPCPEADNGQNELLIADGHVTQLLALAGAPLTKRRPPAIRAGKRPLPTALRAE